MDLGLYMNNKKHLYSSKKSLTQKVEFGSVMAEFLIMLPMLLLIALGSIQWAFIHQAKVTVNHAAFMAARAGSVSQADVGSMRSAFAKGVLPLYSPDKDATGGIDAGKYARAYADSHNPLFTQVYILNPSREAFNDYGVSLGGNQIIPNDRLHLKPATALGASRVSIQDANLLKIQVLYGYKMKLPFIAGVMQWFGQRSTSNPIKQAMWADGRIPVLATSTVRMQSSAKLSNAVLAMAEVDGLLESDALPPLLASSYAGNRPWESGPSGGDDGNFNFDGGPIDPDFGNGDGGDTGGGGDPGNGDDPDDGPSDCDPGDIACFLDNDDGNGDPQFCEIPMDNPGDGGMTPIDPVNPSPFDPINPFPICNPRIQSCGIIPKSSPINSSLPSVKNLNVGLTSQGLGLPALAVGNPINVVTGNKYQKETDLRQLSGSLGLQFQRHYNSRTNHKGSLGYNWRHSYDVMIQRVEDSDPQRVRLSQSDGRTIPFTKLARQSEYPYINPETILGVYQAASKNDGIVIDRGEQGYDWVRNAHHAQSHMNLEFSKEGYLTRITQGLGKTSQTISLHYDAKGKTLSGVTDSKQRRLTFAHYKNGRIKYMTDPAGYQTRYTYDQFGNLSTVTYADKTQKTYHYEDKSDKHNLTGITDERGIRFATYAYDQSDRAILSSHADGVGKVTLEYADAKMLTEKPTQRKHHFTRTVHVTNSLGQESIYETEVLNGIPRVLAIKGPGCSSCSNTSDVEYTYNNQHQVTKILNKDGSATLHSYDLQGRHSKTEIQNAQQVLNNEKTLVAQFEFLGNTDKVNKISSPSINPKALRTASIEYDQNDNIKNIALSGYQPMESGEFKAITLQQSEQKLFTEEFKRQKTEQENFVFNTNSYAQVSNLAIDDQNLEVKYTVRGKIAEIKTNKGTVKYNYTKDGKLKQFTTPNLSATWEYDSAGRVTKKVSGSLSQIFEWNTENQIKQKQWLVNNKPISTLHFDYDDNKRLIALRNQSKDIVKRYEYDAFNNMQVIDTTKAKNSPNSNNPFQRVSLNGNAQLEKIIDNNNNATEYGVDDFGRTVYVSSPDTGVTTYSYFANGRMKTKTNAIGNTAKFDYSKHDYLSSVIMGDDLLAFDWQENTQGDQQIGSIKQLQSSERFEYNQEGQVSAFIRHIGEQTYTTKYKYDTSGLLIAKVLPDGQQINYKRDKDNNVVSVEKANSLFLDSKLIKILPSTASFGKSFKHGNGIETHLEYHNNRIARLKVGNLHDFRYMHDSFAQSRNKIVGINDGEKVYHRYRFDKNGRLDFAITPRGLYGYQYDANGNRTDKVVNGVRANYRYASDSNRLDHAGLELKHNRKLKNDDVTIVKASSSESSFNKKQIEQTIRNPFQYKAEYLPTGEVTKYGPYRFEYNSNGQATSVYVLDKLLAKYQYNTRAERISKTNFNYAGKVVDETHYLYEKHKLVAEANASGEILRQYIYADNKIVSILEGKKSYSVHTNHLGAPIAVTDKKQTIVWKSDYAPYGRAFFNSDPDKDGLEFNLNIRLPGQYADNETGLYYNYHRFYDPDSGRYLQSDPLGMNAGLNTYAYVNSDPVNNIDPLGLILFAFDGTGNSDPAQPGSSLSNVVHIRDAYQRQGSEAVNQFGRDWFYITGPGTDDTATGYDAPFNDNATGSSIPARVEIMTRYLLDYLDMLHNDGVTGQVTNIDVTGFSRGAAAARVFANVVSSFMDGNLEVIMDGLSRAQAGSRIGNNDLRIDLDRLQRVYDDFQCNNNSLNLGFMGLFDTVPHYFLPQGTGGPGGLTDDLSELPLGIPSGFDHVSQAIAVTEDRADFNAISIHQNASANSNGNRVERGFIGAHSDIGGGYGDGDLSDVALNWMAAQARQGGANVNITNADLRVVTNPILHSSLDIFPFYNADREVRYLDGSFTDQLGDELFINQPAWNEDGRFGMNYETAEDYFGYEYSTEDQICSAGGCIHDGSYTQGRDINGDRTLVGLVTPGYAKWLKDQYGLDITINNSGLTTPVP